MSQREVSLEPRFILLTTKLTICNFYRRVLLETIFPGKMCLHQYVLLRTRKVLKRSSDERHLISVIAITVHAFLIGVSWFTHLLFRHVSNKFGFFNWIGKTCIFYY